MRLRGWRGNSSYSKYRNKKTVLDGITFDSKKEASRYYTLKADPDIIMLECHPKYILQEGYKKDGRAVRAITYSPDFRYIRRAQPNRVRLEDVKPITKRGPFTTEVFRLKAKLFHFRYPELTIEIV